MTSAPNRLPQLSGNRWLVFLLITLIVGACSPKVRWVSHPAGKPVDTVKRQPVVVAPPKAKPGVQKQSVISLLLPFGLDHIGPGLGYTDVSLRKARIAADYYRGFKLALDSLTFYGYNYKLQVYDSRDDAAQAHSLAYNQQIRASDLIVGPVFPEGLKALTSVLTSPRKAIVSPLSPEAPGVFSNQNLVTMNPPLEFHAWCAGLYVYEHMKPQKVFILRSGYSGENDYINLFKHTIDTLSKHHIKVIQLTVKRGQLAPLIAQLSKTQQNVFFVPSTDEPFLLVTLRSLDTLANKYPVTLFGHPSWEHFTFLKAELLQHLKTHITSEGSVDYKSEATITFIRNYRAAYHTEPSDYSIKGFDEGMYFGQLLATTGVKDLDQKPYGGLHGKFNFAKIPGQGWVNSHVNLLLYSNFELKPVE